MADKVLLFRAGKTGRQMDLSWVSALYHAAGIGFKSLSNAYERLCIFGAVTDFFIVQAEKKRV